MTTTTTTAVCVSHAGSGDLWVLHLDAERGTLAPVQRVAIGGQVMPLALSPDRSRLYAARRSAPLEVLSFAVDAASGRLAAIGAAPLPASMAYLSVDATGRFLLGASYGADLIAVSPMDARGVAQAAQQVLATPANAHAVVADPSNRFVFATHLGGGVVTQWHFDAASGRLVPNEAPALRPRAGASPRHLVFAADGRVAWLLNELDAQIDVLALDAATGTLATRQTVATLPPGFTGAPWAADLHATPDGRFLYASERRSSTLAGFAVDAASGRLAPLAPLASASHWPTEAEPRGFAITPDGRFLIAAGQAADALAVFAIDVASGALTRRSTCAVGQGPNWIECVALG